IEIENLEKTFAGRSGRQPTVALTNSTFSVADGEICCLLGPSGCGKSTILNILAGFDSSTGGHATVGGKPVDKPHPSRALVFQQPQLFPWLDVWDNILFGPRMSGLPRAEAEARANRLLQATSLSEFKRHRVYELSGGMRQRVAIARALINRPEVLLMDEPFGALDAQTRATMQQLLLSIWEDLRPTIIFVTHDVDEALFLGDQVCVMSARPGRIRERLRVTIRRPRTLEVTTSEEFVTLKRSILGAIRAEVEATG
ncbi:MAG: ABC transporter ATP-binding protein, partial [Vulcanimicrobiaceae bacterium]